MARYYKGIRLPDESFAMQDDLKGGSKKGSKKAKKAESKAESKAEPKTVTVEYSSSDLNKMNKSGVEDVAEELGIDFADKTKKELIEEILNS